MIRCDMCGRRFRDERDLRRFVKTEYGLIPYAGQTSEKEVVRACPNCKSDKYLMRIA